MASKQQLLVPHQALRLEIEDQRFSGAIVSIDDEHMLVATPLRALPELSIGATVAGEVPQPDGLILFGARLKAYQLAPMLLLILTRPKALRKVERRTHSRHLVRLPAQLVFISPEGSLNVQGEVRDVSLAGLGLHLPEAPPVGVHVVVLFSDEAGHAYATLCQTAHAAPSDGGHQIGVHFSEMSRADREALVALNKRSRANEAPNPAPEPN